MERALSVYLTLACVPIGLGGHEDPISEFEAIIISGKKTVNLRPWIGPLPSQHQACVYVLAGSAASLSLSKAITID